MRRWFWQCGGCLHRGWEMQDYTLAKRGEPRSDACPPWEQCRQPRRSPEWICMFKGCPTFWFCIVKGCPTFWRSNRMGRKCGAEATCAGVCVCAPPVCVWFCVTCAGVRKCAPPGFLCVCRIPVTFGGCASCGHGRCREVLGPAGRSARRAARRHTWPWPCGRARRPPAPASPPPAARSGSR